MIFEDWEDSFPIINPERVATPIEATVEFFAIPKDKRNHRLNYTDEFEDLSQITHKKIKRSVWEFSNEIKKHTNLNFLNVPNIARGIQISVRELSNQDKILGHNKYDYYLPKRELLWTRFDKKWQEALDNGETLAGLPECIFMTFEWLTLDELQWVRCPAKDKNSNALKGMSREFLEKLGITDEKVINGEVGLIFEFMIAF
jgi:hypothetical protein